MKKKWLILSIVIGIFIFLISNVSVSALPGCCERTVDGEYCIQTDDSNCNIEGGYQFAPTSCESTSYCKLGCGYSSDNGRCFKYTPKAACDAEDNCTYSDSPGCENPQCQKGCCILGDQSFFVTQVQCKKTASLYEDVVMDFDNTIDSELACLEQSQSQELGCCVTSNSCSFTARANCKAPSKVTSINATEEDKVGFHKDMLCSNDRLDCSCAKQQKTSCVGEDLFWFDSCGNRENIYNSNKRDSYNDGFILKEEESCKIKGPNDKDCGNCDYPGSTLCGEDKNKVMPIGDSTCVSIGCKDVYQDPYSPNSGGDKKNGESWCIYDSQVGLSRDLVGSRQYRHVCINGQETVEPCKDYRDEICIQGVPGEDALKNLDAFLLTGAEYTEAACRKNRWQDCNSCNTLTQLPDQKNQENLPKGKPEPSALVALKKQCCQNEDVRDCNWLQTGISDAGGVCVPQIPPGLKHWGAASASAQTAATTANAAGANIGVTASSPAEQTCAQANTECKVIFQIGGWKKFAALFKGKTDRDNYLKKNAKITQNKECVDKRWVIAGNNYCKAQGDCGAYFNILGQSTGEGYVNTIVFESQFFDGSKYALTQTDYGDFRTLVGKPSNKKDSTWDALKNDAGFWLTIGGFLTSGVMGAVGSSEQNKSIFSGFGKGLFGGISSLASTGQKCKGTSKKKSATKTTSSKDSKKLIKDFIAEGNKIQAELKTLDDKTFKANSKEYDTKHNGINDKILILEKKIKTAKITTKEKQELQKMLELLWTLWRKGIPTATASDLPTLSTTDKPKVTSTGESTTDSDAFKTDPFPQPSPNQVITLSVAIDSITGGASSIDTITGAAIAKSTTPSSTNTFSAAQALINSGQNPSGLPGLLGGAVKSNVCGKGFGGKSASIYGSAGSLGSLINLGSWAALIYTSVQFGSKQEFTRTYQIQCKPWQAPANSQDCEKCNDKDKPCSEYRCKSLGQNCVLINGGSGNESCISLDVNDVTSPVIIPDSESMNPLSIIETTQEGNKGFKINELIRAFTPITLAIQTNEPAQCKYDFTPGKPYEKMQNIFGSTQYLYNQSASLSLPQSFINSNITKSTNNELTIYLKCQDANGNKNDNDQDYFMKFEVDDSPDLTPPIIRFTSLENEVFIAYGETEINLNIYINEPSECRWSRRDTGYELMENDFDCETNHLSQSVDYENTYECFTRIKNLTNRENNFYFKCKDKPEAPDDDRNINEDSYEFILIGSESPLEILSVTPSGTQFSHDTVMTVLTDGGAENGKADCAFSQEDVPFSEMIIFDTSGDAKSEQPLLSLPQGEYSYFISCLDAGVNEARDKIEFTVDIDTYPPKISSLYVDQFLGQLYMNLDEPATCEYLNTEDFILGEGTRFSGINETTQSTDYDFNTKKLYNVQCVDNFGNQGKYTLYA